MTDSNRLTRDEQAADNSRIRKMALATINASIAKIITISFLVSGFLYFPAAIVYSHNFNVGYQTAATAIAHAAIIPFAAPVALAINLLVSYNNGIAKAKTLKEIKKHRFHITHLSGNTYYIEGIVTRAETQIEYGTSLRGEELKAFEQL